MHILIPAVPVGFYVRQRPPLTLPESVSRIDGSAFRQSGVCEITFLGDAPSLSAADESLLSFPANAVLWYDPQQEGWDTPTLSGYACYPIGTVLRSGGDTDGDGFTTENDAQLLAKNLCGLVGTDEENRFSGDINGDHPLNVQDVILILNEVKTPSDLKPQSGYKKVNPAIRPNTPCQTAWGVWL